MNYIKHLTGFFEKVTQDNTLNPTHVSLYIALFQFWNCNRFRNPISISRDEVMRISKISSKATYHKCLKNLHALGYIKYEPSYNPFRGSHVVMFNFADDLKPHSKTSSKNELSFNSSSKQVLNKQKTAAEQVMVPSINNSNQSNNSNELNSNKQAKYNKKNITSFDNNSTAEKEESCAKEEKENQKALSYFNPTRDEVLDYFEKQTFPSIEGNKFYNYFSSIGWLVGGKTPMVNWQSAAENWMLNTQKFAGISIPINHLGTSIHKNYSEPL